MLSRSCCKFVSTKFDSKASNLLHDGDLSGIRKAIFIFLSTCCRLERGSVKVSLSGGRQAASQVWEIGTETFLLVLCKGRLVIRLISVSSLF
jgi:hypothetical protein